MRALLDVNVLIALLDAGHIHHVQATAWLEGEIGNGWATCPITQNGCIRIMSQPGYPDSLPAAAVAGRLAEAMSDASHEFWPDTVNLATNETLNWPKVLGHRQVTDAYLLALAVSNNGRLVTLDRRISIESVAKAQAGNLVSILDK